MFKPLSLLAGGDISPARFVYVSAAFTVSQCTAITQTPIGVATEATKDPPGLTGASALAAEAGDQISVWPIGQMCKVSAGAAFSAGALLSTAADGQAITATGTGTVVAAIAFEAATAADQLVDILILSPYQLN